MPSRIGSLRIALPHILPQVDRLYVYLDKYTEVPRELAGNNRIVPLLPARGERSLGCAGKFSCLVLNPEPCLFFGFDDDIVYHAGYVDHMAAALAKFRYKALIGLHGAVYDFPAASYVANRRIIHFSRELEGDFRVDELGTGTVAFHSGCLTLAPGNWRYPNMTDLFLMLDAVRQNVRRVCVARPEGLLQPIAQKQEDSLFARSLADDSKETFLLQAAMKHYPGAWCMSP